MSNQQFLAIGDDDSKLDILSESARNQYKQIERFLHETWVKDEAQRRHIMKMYGCLQKLDAALLQLHRMKNHHASFSNKTRSMLSEHGLMAERGDTAIADFESLLLQGRATLDRLTWFVAPLYKNSTQSFRSLPNILDAHRKKDSVAQSIFDCIQEALPGLVTLADLDAASALRDEVAHFQSLSENVITCFNILRTRDNRFLLFDCEIEIPRTQKIVPIIGTSCELARYLPFTILNVLSAIAGIPVLAFDEYKSDWKNNTVAHSRFAIDEPMGSSLTQQATHIIQRTTPDGFEMKTRNMQPSLWDHTISA